MLPDSRDVERDLYCHNCCELVKLRPQEYSCRYCNGPQLELVTDISTLQRQAVSYTFVVSKWTLNDEFRSPPNVAEPRRPLIIVQNQIVAPEQLEQRRRSQQLDITYLDKRTAVSTLTNDTECSICLAPYQFADRIPITSNVEPSEVSKLLCGHVFHYDCAKSWFKNTSKNECPFCRQKAIDIQS